jgi:hypothetical protein
MVVVGEEDLVSGLEVNSADDEIGAFAGVPRNGEGVTT